MRTPHAHAVVTHRCALPWPAWVSTALAACSLPQALANPHGLSVLQGLASISSTANGAQLNVSVTDHAVLRWDSFNIGAGEATHFSQPSPASVVWNHIGDATPSVILGQLTANGTVVLVNPAGFRFGPDAFVSAAGLVVSTARPAPVDSAAGLFWQFQGPPPAASIINYGRIQADSGGSLFLIAEHVANHGALSAPSGTIGLLSAGQVLLSPRPDGRGLSAAIDAPSGTVLNNGSILADAGAVALRARVVNQDGIIQANSVRQHEGRIELIASDVLALGPASGVAARGGADASPSPGGAVELKAGRAFLDASGSTIDVRGGTSGGAGGRVEVCAPDMPALNSRIDGTALPGWLGGDLYIDPQDIVLGYTGTGSAGNGSVPPTAPPVAGALNLDVGSAFTGLSRIHLQATRNIKLAAGTLWDLVGSTGVSAPGSRLLLEAGNNITLANGSRIEAGPGWSVSLIAGRDFSQPDLVRPGVGNVALNGSAGIQAADGSVSVLAGNNVTLASGFIRSTAGGDLSVRALAGTINAGTRPNGFLFRPDGYLVDPDLGGISTANGGHVTLVAGQDVVGSLPVAGGPSSNGGSGAFGPAPGNVTIRAGRDVQGHFVLAHGTGTIEAGRNAGAATRLLALSLVDGSWNVAAGQDVLLQEVRNPNGIFNNLGASTSPFRHRFDYAEDASVSLAAGNGIQLRGSALPRYADSFSQGMTPIYPGILSLRAGSGGVTLGNDLTLFPSPVGNLAITTTDSGPLVGTKPGDLTQLVVSDSAARQYRSYGTFGINDHAPVPIQLGNPNPIQVNVSGDVRSVLFGFPRQARLTVGGDFINSRFEGQNLRATDVTSLVVAGDIRNRNVFTSVPLASKPDFSPFELGLVYPPPSGSLAGVESLFAYDGATQTLTFQGRMTGEQLQFLLNLPVQAFDNAGQPLFQPNGEPLTRTIQVLPPDVAQALYNLSQDVPLNADTGYRVGGGGAIVVSANNLDLGATAGIVSHGPRANPALAALFTRGADIQVSLRGDLDMFSSAIASLHGGSISVVSDGAVSVGSRTFKRESSEARGIFTVDASDVTVVARRNIDVNGSRIAAYDGGNVLVRSLEGNVDAGSGAGGAATVEKIVVDPVTRQILSYAPTIPGSGILATTFPRSLDPAFPTSQSVVGDITVQTPRGDIIANAGGVVQIPLNGVGASQGTVTLSAGTRDANGNVVHVGNIDASGSGVIGSTVRLNASGGITGLVFARENIDLTAAQSVSVTALAQGNVNVSAGGTVSGTLIGIGSVNASGANVDASLLSQNVSASGNVASGQVGFGQGSAASGAAQSSVQGDQPAKAAAKGAPEDDPRRRNVASATAPRLTRTVGRVTVILPPTSKPN
jgi:filamentous hemagglutinin family protein